MKTINEIKLMAGIPLPKIKRRSKLSQYPFESMNVGQCFDAPDLKRSQIYNMNKKLSPKKFTLREGRVWRMK